MEMKHVYLVEKVHIETGIKTHKQAAVPQYAIPVYIKKVFNQNKMYGVQEILIQDLLNFSISKKRFKKHFIIKKSISILYLR